MEMRWLRADWLVHRELSNDTRHDSSSKRGGGYAALFRGVPSLLQCETVPTHKFSKAKEAVKKKGTASATVVSRVLIYEVFFCPRPGTAKLDL